MSPWYELPRHIPVMSGPVHSRQHHSHIPEARRVDVVASVAVVAGRIAEVAGAKGR